MALIDKSPTRPSVPSSLTPATRIEFLLLSIWLEVPIAERLIFPAEVTLPVLVTFANVIKVISPWACILPALLIPPSVFRSISEALLMSPRFVSKPSALRETWPTVAPIFPALRTPMPASVPIRTILPAYMPPNCATSNANTGTRPTPSTLLIDAWAASTWLVPVITLRFLAQIPALTSTARAMMPV